MNTKDLIQRLADLRSRDRQHALFGACQHRHLAFSVATEEEVAVFERAQGIELPEEYREYVTQVSSGGVGPGYGMYAFAGSYMDCGAATLPSKLRTRRLFRTEQEQRDAREALEAELTQEKADLAADATLTRGIQELQGIDERLDRLVDAATEDVRIRGSALTYAAWLREHPGWLAVPFAFTSPFELPPEIFEGADEQGEDGLEQALQKYKMELWDQGAIPLCHYGCGYYAFLVTSGAERGHVWIWDVDAVLVTPFPPPWQEHGLRPTERRYGFLDWFESWLVEAEAFIKSSTARSGKVFRTRDPNSIALIYGSQEPD